MSAKRALLVGVNSYPKFGPGQQLAGCVNDVEAIAALLRASYGFEDVVMLRDAEATRDGILGALEDLARRVGDSDIVVVHYSGHGSQMTDREGDEPDGKDETLVPYDSGRKPHPNRDITDDEVYAWVRRVTERTQNLTLIFDCCHSGTISRDAFGSRSRWVTPDDRPASELPPSPVADGARGARDAGPSGWLPIENYVLIAGCQDDESSYEHDATDGGSVVEHGALTYFLTQELARAVPGTTYRDVFEPVRARVSAAYPRQHPQLEGSTDRELFGVRDFEPMRFVAVSRREGATVTLAAGAAHGVVADSEWDIYPHGTKQIGPGVEPVGRVRVTAVRAVETDAQIASETAADAIAANSRAVEAIRPLTAPRLRVAVAAPGDQEPHAAALRSRLAGSSLVVPDDGGASADLQAYVVARRASSAQPVPQLGAVEHPSWAVVGRDGRLAMPVHAVDKDGVVDLLAENVEKLARYRNGLALSNEVPGSTIRGRVDVRLQLRAQDGSWQDVRPGGDGRTILHENDQFRLEIANRHDVPVYAAVLDFGVTGKIDLLYPFGGTSEAIAPGRSLVIGERETFTLGFPEGFPFVRDPADREPVEGYETLKVFAVAEKPVMFDWLRQEGVRSAALAERASLDDVVAEALVGRSRDVAAVRASSAQQLEDWTTIELPIVLRRREPSKDEPAAVTATSAGAQPAATSAAPQGTVTAMPDRASLTPAAPQADAAQEELIEQEEPEELEELEEPEAPSVYDPEFARNVGLTLVLVGLLVLWPLWIVSARVVFGDAPEASLSELIAIQFVVAGVAVAFGGVYLALLEFRGRARAVQLSGAAAQTRRGRGLGADAIKATPDILKAFGQLKPLASLLVIAALLFLCATVLAWRGLGA